MSLAGTRRLAYCDQHTIVTGKRKEKLDAFNLRQKAERERLRSWDAMNELRARIMEEL